MKLQLFIKIKLINEITIIYKNYQIFIKTTVLLLYSFMTLS